MSAYRGAGITRETGENKIEEDDMFGFRKKEGELSEAGKIIEEAKGWKRLEEETLKRQKEFNDAKSICLSCKNAFVMEYLQAGCGDPLLVKCKIRHDIYHRDGYKTIDDCSSSVWHLKVLKCSDYKRRKSGAKF